MLEDVIIRPIRPEDVQRIHTVALEAWRYTYRDIFDPQFIENFVNQNYEPEATLALFPRLHSGTMCFDVAEYESKVIGFCNIGIHRNIGELYRIYLLPGYIGRGIGKNLLQRGETFLQAHHIDTYFCFVHKDNERGKQFYLRNGFQRIPKRDQDDEWYMQKSIVST